MLVCVLLSLLVCTEYLLRQRDRAALDFYCGLASSYLRFETEFSTEASASEPA